MPPAFAMGEAAGTAAALSVRRQIPPRAVPVADLQAVLLQGGAYLDPRVAEQVETGVAV
jgi:hypothetical protein